MVWHFLAFVGFLVSLWLIQDLRALPAKIRDDILERTFPTVFALPILRMEERAETCKGKPFDYRAELKPVISLETYCASQPPLEHPPPIFIMMLESITAGHIAFNGYTRKELTPNIDRLMAESISFTRAYAPANHSNYAQTSFSSSQYARRRRYLDFFDQVDYPKVLLSDILAKYGYQTAFISSQNEDWQGMRKFTLHESHFDHYYHSKNALGGDIDIERKIDDSEVVDEAMRTLERFDKARPSYMYLNMQRTHYPYTLPESAERPYQPSELTSSDTYFHYPAEHISSMVNRYDNAMRYVDKQVGVFIDYLKAKDLYEQAIIVIASDHGEGFYAQGYPTHGTSMFDDQIRSFAAIKVPHGKKVEVRNDAISLIDINPSILELLNLRNHPSFQGRPIIKGPENGRCLFSTGQGVMKMDCVIQYPWKFVRSQRDGKRLIHLEWDEKETRDYSSDYPDKRRELEDALLHHVGKQLFYYNDLSSEERGKYYPPQF
jgi:arylsulfatase